MNEPLAPEDQQLLRVIARVHGHGRPRPIALLDIAWAETGSEDAGRDALQRLILLGCIKLAPGRPTREMFGTLTDTGVRLARSQAVSSGPAEK